METDLEVTLNLSLKLLKVKNCSIHFDIILSIAYRLEYYIFIQQGFSTTKRLQFGATSHQYPTHQRIDTQLNIINFQIFYPYIYTHYIISKH